MVAHYYLSRIKFSQIGSWKGRSTNPVGYRIPSKIMAHTVQQITVNATSFNYRNNIDFQVTTIHRLLVNATLRSAIFQAIQENCDVITKDPFGISDLYQQKINQSKATPNRHRNKSSNNVSMQVQRQNQLNVSVIFQNFSTKIAQVSAQRNILEVRTPIDEIIYSKATPNRRKKIRHRSNLSKSYRSCDLE